ncbi:MAG: hypothetical protein MJ180_02885, partial [Candidatus Gastranaerophilales bacterium]|nr:hypothetical protein [Candidatus Gastranaerophilales bacterium]
STIFLAKVLLIPDTYSKKITANSNEEKMKVTISEIIKQKTSKPKLSSRIKNAIKKILDKFGITRKIGKQSITIPKEAVKTVTPLKPKKTIQKTFAYHSPEMVKPDYTAEIKEKGELSINMEELKNKSILTINMPENPNLKPVKGDTSIKPADKHFVGKTINTPLMIDYNSIQEWSIETVARDIFQNFYDGQGGTLDGVKIEVKVVDGKYRIKITGDSEYSYSYMKNIAASTKTGDEKQAGGFGEGAKMAAKTLLSRGFIDRISFASGEWKMEFAKEEGVERKDMHMTRKLTENANKLNGNSVEFETGDEAFVKAILKAKDYFRHSDNPDFKDFDFENDKFGFKVLTSDANGNLYYGQRYAMKDNGELEGTLRGIRIVFKEEVPSADKVAYGIANDCDRKGLTSNELRIISEIFANSMTDEELVSSIQRLERFWIQDYDSFRGTLKSNEGPGTDFVFGLINAATRRGIKFDTKDVKIAIKDYKVSDKEISELRREGYQFAELELSYIGFKTASDIIAERNKTKEIKMTDIEKQKLALLQELLPKAKLKLVDKIKNESFHYDRVKKITSEGCVAIERSFFESADFNTLYSELLTQILYSRDGATWGYSMTDALGTQLKFSSNPEYMAKYNAIKKAYEQLRQ